MKSVLARGLELGKRRRALEGDVDLLRPKLSKLKDQLMSVKTNREYTAMLHEIQTAEAQIRAEEDKVLDIMEEMESMEGHLKGAETGPESPDGADPGANPAMAGVGPRARSGVEPPAV